MTDSWPLLGCPGALWGLSWAARGGSRGSWAVLGASWASLGPSWSPLGPLLVGAGRLQGLSWAVLERFLASLDLSWTGFGLSWVVLSGSWASLGRQNVISMKPCKNHCFSRFLGLRAPLRASLGELLGPSCPEVGLKLGSSWAEVGLKLAQVGLK